MIDGIPYEIDIHVIGIYVKTDQFIHLPSSKCPVWNLHLADVGLKRSSPSPVVVSCGNSTSRCYKKSVYGVLPDFYPRHFPRPW